ncbi:hypothetical protein AJ80_05944 [Polytolypa hystricis UAMH7299]|uniref:Uncharacterized protein n=1 Tax=Polytolypa hystricis (strain UAMH7299) TaxID=1447883 RepID=A0A2B7XRG2_POLH7|nr:hypothetical protein AJ80_05944 [Polytolypa hystricis UAMH7299]
MLELVSTSELAVDANREHRINCNYFQQDAILTYNGWQYVTFYSNKDDTISGGPLLVNISRRQLGSDIFASKNWETLTFSDYEQTVDDGHNTISIGIYASDGTIHILFDHHCDQALMRSFFAATELDRLGLEILFNSYINAISHVKGRIYVSGTYRKFIHYDGVDDPNSTKHEANAGPNGPENNYSLFYTYNDDGGLTFRKSGNRPIASLRMKRASILMLKDL